MKAGRAKFSFRTDSFPDVRRPSHVHNSAPLALMNDLTGLDQWHAGRMKGVHMSRSDGADDRPVLHLWDCG